MRETSHVVLEAEVEMHELVKRQEIHVPVLMDVEEDVGLVSARNFVRQTFNKIDKTIMKMNRSLGSSIPR